MSTPAIWSFAGVAVLFAGVVVMLVRTARSTFRRGRQLAEELTALGVDVEEVMAAVGQSTAAQGPQRSTERTIESAETE
jgi:predicted nuclease with RNAse H fold